MTKNIDAFHLKLIAIVAMLLNHIGNGFDFMSFSPPLFWLTEFIGKLTFPIMAYLLVEGFHYTRNRWKYGLRLAFFSLVSVVPFHIYFENNWQFEVTDLFNNVLFTLLMGLCMMAVCELTDNRFLHVLIVLFFMLTTSLSDWNLFGILIIYWYYRIKDPRKRVVLPIVYVILLLGLMMIPAVGMMSESEIFDNLFYLTTMTGLFLTIPLLLRYNGQRGYSPKWVKYGYYLFYPVHLLMLYLIRSVLF